jgi:hypothetical protein
LIYWTVNSMGNEQGRPMTTEELRNREISQMDQEVKRKLGKGQTYNCMLFGLPLKLFARTLVGLWKEPPYWSC